MLIGGWDMSVKPTATEAGPGTEQSQPGRRHAWPQIGAPGRDGGAMLDTSMARRFAAELIGTGLLVFFGAGMATVTLGFRAFGSSVAAGILLIGLTFGLVLLALFALIGPISGCHVNPAVCSAPCCSGESWSTRRSTRGRGSASALPATTVCHYCMSRGAARS
jgi:hypothetical protein